MLSSVFHHEMSFPGPYHGARVVFSGTFSFFVYVRGRKRRLYPVTLFTSLAISSKYMNALLRHRFLQEASMQADAMLKHNAMDQNTALIRAVGEGSSVEFSLLLER